MTEDTAQPTGPVAFIGVGTMGRPMAERLLAAGWDLTVYDASPAAMEPLLGAGARPAGSACDAALGASYVVTMLPNSSHVRAATVGPDGALSGMRPGAILIDMSTIDPDTSREIAAAAAGQGIAMLDAPVSGSSAGAIDGSLTIMVGGAAQTLDRATPLLSVLGRRIVHCGAAGMGATVKLANQIMAGVSMVAVAESFRLAAALGVDPRLLYDVTTSSSGNCWSLQTRPPVPGVLESSPVERGFQPGFMGDLMRKDLDLALQTAARVDLALPLTAAARELYARLGAAGLGARDFSAVIAVLEGVPAPA
jgi:3-hydroxyisobutyrate dehydrogenase